MYGGKVRECIVTTQYSRVNDGSPGVGRSMHCAGMRPRVRHGNIVCCEHRSEI